MADDVLDERALRARVEHEPVDGRRWHDERAGLVQVAEVFRREDGHDALARARRRRVQPVEAGMGVWAAHDGGMEHPRTMDVVHEKRLAAQQARVFVTPDRFAEVSRGQGSGRWGED